ncbi:MAG TPA: hypothetical protein DF383_07575, partial [Deltaproteobacteria bacterium]|nr:hypothetical protein [Deltaproteobacteria bacterium]
LVRDCYRPEKAVNDFVRWVQDPSLSATKRIFYPDLAKADLIRLNYISPISGHARGTSIDLTIVERSADGKTRELPMGTIIDFFGERAHTAFPDLNREEKKNRELLLEIMQPEFKNYPKEWWHFVLKEEPLPKKAYDFDIVAGPSIITQVSDPELLEEWDAGTRGPLSLVTLFKRIHSENHLAVPDLGADAESTGETLAKFTETYGRFASTLASDISRIITEAGIDWEKDIHKTYRPGAARTERGKSLRLNGNVMRVFNEKWLSSRDGLFILAGIVNRMDRKDFELGSCGELRFIYRLSYRIVAGGNVAASRMPLTINMVFLYPDDGDKCRKTASLWKMGNNAATAQWLQGPLNFSRLQFKKMEINAQIARFPSDLENDEERHFAGQAIYWMRIFALSQGQMEAQKLENTPDVTGILRDENKQQLLKSFIATHLSQIDMGVFRLPEELLTDLALTYSTLGSARAANKPFDLLLNAKEAQEILDGFPQKESFRFLGSGSAVLERLNTSSCMGCHQSASTAGFHFLGQDRDDFGDGNRLQLAFSPHFYSEIPRCRAYVERLIRGESPNTFRPHPAAPPAIWEDEAVSFQSAQVNMPCFTNNGALANYASWSCDKTEGLSCENLVQNSGLGNVLGQCIPPANKTFSGLACRKNDIEDRTLKFTPDSPDFKRNLIAYNLISFQDRVTKDDSFYGLPEGKLNAQQLNCRPTRIGVPLGRATRGCTPSEKSLEGMKPGGTEICAIVGGSGFEEMAKGIFDSRKFAAGVNRGMLNTCGPGRYCREDYICQELPDFLSNARFGVKPETLARLHEQGVGFC